MSLAPWKEADFVQVPSIGSSGRIQLAQEYLHPFVPRLLCSHFVLGKLCRWRTSGQGWAQCCSLLKLRGPTEVTPPMLPHFNPHESKCRGCFCCSKVFLYLKPKDWASLPSQDFESWLLLLKISPRIWSWEQCKAGHQVTGWSQNSLSMLSWWKGCSSVCGITLWPTWVKVWASI